MRWNDALVFAAATVLNIEAAKTGTMTKEKLLRILAFVDLHGDEKALKILEKKAISADIIICAGDLTVFENKILYLMKRLDKMGKPLLLIPGNHEEPGLLSEICGRLNNIKMMHRKVYTDSRFPSYVFIGHGGEGFTHESEDFERFAKTIALKLKGKKIVLVTHQPPHNTKVDYIWSHHGNKSYTRFVRKYQPLLHVCGHLHETAGMKDKIGKTIVVNPGPKGIIVKV